MNKYTFEDNIITYIAIIGSREYEKYLNKEEIFHLLKETIWFILMRLKVNEFIVVSGGAKGIDSLAREFCNKMNIDIKEYLPDWKKYGRKAGFIRNKTIINNSDIVIALWDMESKGTENSINIAKKQEKIIFLYDMKEKKFKNAYNLSN